MNLQTLTEPIPEAGATRLLIDIVRDNFVISDNKDYKVINNILSGTIGTKLVSSEHLKTCDELFRKKLLLTVNTPSDESYNNLLLKQEKVYRKALTDLIEDKVRSIK